jgi:hypothetical protein
MSEEIEQMSPEKLESLGSYAKRAREIELALDPEVAGSLAHQMAQLAAEHKQITESKMPEILMEIGIEEFKLTTGEKLKLTTYYSASLSDENPQKEVAFEWLRKNGHDSIIKNFVNGTFGKGEEKKAEEAFKLLAKKFPDIFTKKSGVHPMTLKSFVKELCEAGTPPPAEPFKLFIGKKVTIK